LIAAPRDRDHSIALHFTRLQLLSEILCQTLVCNVIEG
jgi:hypothetical protein